MHVNRLIAKLLPYFPRKLVWMVSKKYIAGASLTDALRVIGELNIVNVMATVDILGESINSPEQASEYQRQYLETIEEITNRNLRCTFSLKPTMFGLQTNFDHCLELIREIVAKAAIPGYFVRIDMEDSTCTDDELRLFSKLYVEFPANVGIVLQAYLRRTERDIGELSKISHPDHPVNVRLCKGIYREPREIAFQKHGLINENFIKCLHRIINAGMYPAIATHDQALINTALRLISGYGLKTNAYEFQMLYGVTPRRRQKLIDAGHRMRIYVPFGEQWFKYSMRRLEENPRMVWDILKGLVTRK